MGPVTQYVDQKRDAPLTIAVYAGADGSFSLYEDDGRSEQYKVGAFTRIPIRYDDRTGTVTLGAREGKPWAGMPAARTIRVKWLGADKPMSDDNGRLILRTAAGEPASRRALRSSRRQGGGGVDRATGSAAAEQLLQVAFG